MFRVAEITGVRRVINDSLIDDLRISKYKAESSVPLSENDGLISSPTSCGIQDSGISM